MTMPTGTDIDDARLLQYIKDHPDTAPDQLEGSFMCFLNPGASSPTWRLERFRDRMRDYAKDEPDNRDWPRCVACTEAALAYRETVPPEYRFWSDRPPPP